MQCPNTEYGHEPHVLQPRPALEPQHKCNTTIPLVQLQHAARLRQKVQCSNEFRRKELYARARSLSNVVVSSCYHLLGVDSSQLDSTPHWKQGVFSRTTQTDLQIITHFDFVHLPHFLFTHSPKISIIQYHPIHRKKLYGVSFRS